MSSRALRIVSLALALAIAVPAQAPARHLVVEDPNDTRGALDIKRVTVEKLERPLFNIRTYSRWRTSGIWDAGYFVIWLDTFGDGRFDYYTLLRSDGSKMRGSVWRDFADERNDKFVASAKTYKPTRRRVVTRIPFGELRIGDSRAFYRWQVETLFSSDKCSSVCFDRAPDQEPVVEPLVPEP